MDGTRAKAGWADLGEHGMLWGMRFVVGARRLLGRQLCLLVVLPIVTWFWLTDAPRRRASLDYLRRARRALHRPPPRWWHGLGHFLAFAGKALDAVLAARDLSSIGPCRVHDPDGMAARAAAGQGGLVLVSHFGNADLARAALSGLAGSGMTVLMHTRHAVLYNRMIDRLHGSPLSRTLEVTELTPATAIDFQARLERGEWLAMAADRTPVDPGGRVCRVPFLGEMAAFPSGPFILAAILACPVYLLDCVRHGAGHDIRITLFAERVTLPRAGRDAVLQVLVAGYAARLEASVLRAPMQWYNFYRFWDLYAPETNSLTEAAGLPGLPGFAGVKLHQ